MPSARPCTVGTRGAYDDEVDGDDEEDNDDNEDDGNDADADGDDNDDCIENPQIVFI